MLDPARRSSGAALSCPFFPSAIRARLARSWGTPRYHKDPITAQGMTVRSATPSCFADAIDDTFAGRLSTEDAFAGYEHKAQRSGCRCISDL